MKFELPKLNYAYDALEPNIDARTMEIHHSKHHNGYTNNLNNAIEGTELEGKTIEEICKSDNLSAAVQNNGGGYYNDLKAEPIALRPVVASYDDNNPPAPQLGGNKKRQNKQSQQ